MACRHCNGMEGALSLKHPTSHNNTLANTHHTCNPQVRPASTVIACRTFKEMEDAYEAEARLRRQITDKMKVRVCCVCVCCRC